jgi:hypothetical protein
MTMTVELEGSELELILESLRYTKQAFERYERYPSDEFKAGRVAEVQQLIDKLHGGRRAERRTRGVDLGVERPARP